MVRRRFLALLVCLSSVACTAPGPDRPVAPAPALRIGIAAFDRVDPLASVAELAALGVDYIEPALSKLAALPDAELAAARQRVAATGLRAEAMNWFVPGDLKLTGPAVDTARVLAYLERSLAIAESFGVQRIVFGSPGARSHPDGFPREQAWQQLVVFLRQCADVIEARRYHMIVCIEPLRRPESNLVNHVGEAVQLAREVDRPSVKVVVDFYHLAFEGDDPDVVRQAAPWIAHLQIADPAARGFPRSAASEPRYARFFAALRAVGYQGRLSIEAVAGDLAADTAEGLRFLRAMTAGP